MREIVDSRNFMNHCIIGIKLSVLKQGYTYFYNHFLEIDLKMNFFKFNISSCLSTDLFLCLSISH